MEQSAWDGDWYRRGYFDDGTPLGSAANAECRIDSIAQSWSVISGAGEPQRAATAMASRRIRPASARTAGSTRMPPHVGRGGWTCYTGSAAWLYRAGLEWLLGCSMQGAALRLDPCIPRTWPEFQVALRYGGTRYEIAVENPRGVNRGLVSLQLDGETLPAGQGRVPLLDDGLTHRVRAVLG